MKKPSIPSVVSAPSGLGQVLDPIKQNIEIITGVRGGMLEALPTNASTAQIITAINQIVARLNATGT